MIWIPLYAYEATGELYRRDPHGERDSADLAAAGDLGSAARRGARGSARLRGPHRRPRRGGRPTRAGRIGHHPHGSPLHRTPSPPARAGGGSGSVLSWELADRLGSGVLLVDETGARIEHRVFKPFGELHDVAQVGGGDPYLPRRFAGHLWEQHIGLYSMQARWMDPESGTFLSVDPVVPSSSDPQSLNAYAYARNNPANLNDPSGMCVTIFTCMGVMPGFYGTMQTQSAYTAKAIMNEHGPGVDVFAVFTHQVSISGQNGTASVAYDMRTGDLAGIGMTFATRGGSQGEYASAGGGVGYSPDSRWVGGSYEQMMEVSVNAFDYIGSAEDAWGTPTAFAVRDGVMGAISPEGFHPGNFGVVDLPIGPGRLGHMFRAAAGHVNPSTVSSMGRYLRVFQSVASNPSNLRNVGPTGYEYFTQVFRSGRQVWVEVWKGRIHNAGVNAAGAAR